MRSTLCWLLLLGLVAGPGCSGDKPSKTAEEAGDNTPDGGMVDAGDGGETVERAPGFAPIGDDGAVALSPENTTLQFVGVHTDKSKPDRVGHFGAFQGAMKVDADAMAPTEVELEIETDSLSTEIPALTTHLRGPDFFDAQAHPKASFKSTAVEPGDAEGAYNIQGELTLLGATQPIEIPVIVKSGEGGIQVVGEVTLDRTAFGMDHSLDGIEKEVRLTVNVGLATTGERQGRPGVSAAGTGGPGSGGSGGPGGRRRFNPEERFKEMDADGDGKLTGDEISERMRENLGEIDTDGDESVTLEEMQEFFRAMRERFRGGSGGPGGGPGGGRGGPGGGGPDAGGRPPSDN